MVSRTPHPTHGHMLCHPVNVARHFADSELFLSNFNRIPQQTDLNQAQKGHAAFAKMFPVFQQATSLMVCLQCQLWPLCPTALYHYRQ
jgi:hypothetical protein